MQRFNCTDRAWQVGFGTDKSNGHGGRGKPGRRHADHGKGRSRHACSYLVWAWDNEEGKSAKEPSKGSHSVSK